jgi:multicomponent Na+:H+ antiporter subunit D
MITPHIPLLIPVTFLFMSLIIPLVGYLGRTWAYLAAVLGTALSFVFSLMGLNAVLTTGRMTYHLAGWMPPLGIEFVLDPLSVFMQVIITGVTLMVLIYSKKSLEHEIPEKIIPFYSLSMILMTGLCGMVITGDLFNLYVFLEIGALSGYALLAIGNKRACFSAFRYLTLGTVGAAFYLLGVAFIFMSTGTLNMADVAQLLPLVADSKPVITGLVLIILGAGLKMGLFPLHAWLPDGYTNASSSATALIAPIGTKVAAYVLIRIYFLSDFPPISEVVAWVAAVGIIAGSILAIAQTNIKRMLAYSSVANIGYIALGFSLANQLAFTGAMLHILNHALMKAVLFLAAGGILYKMNTLDITQLRGLPKRMPFTTAAFIIGVLSMVGIPPTGGFFSKIYLIFGAIEAEIWIFVAVILISTMLNFVYFFRVIQFAFFKPYQAKNVKGDNAFEKIKMDELALSMLVPVLILAVVIVLVGFYNGDIVDSIIRLAMPARF